VQSWLSAAWFPSGTAELLELWVPKEVTSKHLKKKNPIALKTMLLKCLLTRRGAALDAASSPTVVC